MKSKRNIGSGFSLIELMVVIAIIGFFAAISGFVAQEVRTEARYTNAKEEMKLISDAIVATRPPGASVLQVTGVACSDCVCRNRGGAQTNLQGVTDSTQCMSYWDYALSRIDQASLLINNNGAEGLLRDPWDAPYLLDENELEFPGALCRNDTLATAGADGLAGTTDDYYLLLPFRTRQCEGQPTFTPDPLFHPDFNS